MGGCHGRLRRIGGKKTLDKRCGEPAFLEIRILKYPAMQRQGRFNPFYHAFLKRASHPCQRFLTVLSMYD
jgi:hypothetical protein